MIVQLAAAVMVTVAVSPIASLLTLSSILPPLVSTYSRRGCGWAGVGSPYLRAYHFVEQMTRIEAFWLNRKPAAGDRSLRRMYQETMPEMGVG